MEDTHLTAGRVLDDDGPSSTSHRITLAGPTPVDDPLVSITQGTNLGRYCVLSELGEGGMGRVVRAYDTRLHREVALKLVRVREDKGDETARVLREAQAMALLSHPNVVAVYDVEQHSPSLIYLAMEYVPGQTLRRWWSSGSRSHAQILSMFVQAGRGLAAAHAANIVHRDFKPSNVMIGDDGRARVTDFGLARGSVGWPLSLTDGGEVPYEPLSAELTQAGVVLGTPPYMAPEQHSGERVDARCDQFAFCVALYEALCGMRPFSGGDVHELFASKLEGPPPLPERAKVPAWLQRVIKRGLEPLPQRRWPSLDALIAALQADPTVLRRRRAMRAATGLGVVASTGLAAFAWMQRPDPCPPPQAQLVAIWDDEGHEQLRAAGRGDAALSPALERIESGLDAYAEDWLLAHQEACAATAIHHQQSPELLDRRMACLQRGRMALRSTVQTLVEAEPVVLLEYGARAVQALPDLGRCDDVEQLAEIAPPATPALALEVERRQAELGNIDALRATGQYPQALAAIAPCIAEVDELGYLPLIAEYQLVFAELLDQGGHYDEAMTATERSFVAGLESRNDEIAAGATLQAGFILGFRLQRFPEALVWTDHGAALARRRGRSDARWKASRATVHLALGQWDQAEALLLAALPELTRAEGTTSVQRIVYLNTLGNLYLDQGRYEEALLRYRETLELASEALGPEHSHVAGALVNLATTRRRLGNLEEAETDARRALAIWTALHGPKHHNVALALTELGAVLAQRGHAEEAIATLREALAVSRATFGPEHLETVEALIELSTVLLAERHWTEAEGLLRRALTILDATVPSGHPLHVPTCLALAEVLQATDRAAEALPLIERAASVAGASFPAAHPDRVRAERARARALHGDG